jgi:hypothetical protein
MGMPCHGVQQADSEATTHTSHHEGTPTFADDGCRMHCVGIAILALVPGLPTTLLWRGISDRSASPTLLAPDRLDRPPKVLA